MVSNQYFYLIKKERGISKIRNATSRAFRHILLAVWLIPLHQWDSALCNVQRDAITDGRLGNHCFEIYPRRRLSVDHHAISRARSSQRVCLHCHSRLLCSITASSCQKCVSQRYECVINRLEIRSSHGGFPGRHRGFGQLLRDVSFFFSSIIRLFRIWSLPGFPWSALSLPRCRARVRPLFLHAPAQQNPDNAWDERTERCIRIRVEKCTFQTISSFSWHDSYSLLMHWSCLMTFCVNTLRFI